jgi:multiple sugar transport system permease protein
MSNVVAPGGAATAEAASRTSPAAPRRKKALTDRAREERRLAWMLCAPAVLTMLLVTGYPVLYSLWLSFQQADLRFPEDRAFVGLGNYVEVLTATTWWRDLLATVIITVISVAVELVLGMLLALVMHRAIFARGATRAAILVPYGIVTVVAAFSWRYAFDPTTGFVNEWFNLETALLTTQGGSYAAIIATEVWKTTPFMALLLLAGLSLVPDELHEAAKIDGATAVQRFFRITLPLIKPAILVALLFRTLDAFRIFDAAYVLTGGANNTETVSILGYNQLINRLNLGLGSAISVLIFLCVIVIAFTFVKGFGASAGSQQQGGK